ncbi:MAG: hypothetical protein ABMA01_19305 [Chthoniobacteraceae bacterium]
MKRFVLSICIATAALGLGACEPHSAENLPEHYKHKGGHHADADHGKAPAQGEKAHAPAPAHKG